MGYSLPEGREGASLAEVGCVHGVPGPAQFVGKCDDAGRQTLRVVEEQDFTQLCPPGQKKESNDPKVLEDLPPSRRARPQTLCAATVSKNATYATQSCSWRALARRSERGRSLEEEVPGPCAKLWHRAPG
jgi:hypothetical protein